MGRRLKMKPDCSGDSPWCGENDATFQPVPNSKLLVSIAQAFGQEVDKFGTQPDPALTSGALSELV